MPRAFSLDLRSRIVHACEQQELSQSEIAELFQVHPKTVEKYWHLARTGQSLAPRPHTSGPARKLGGSAEQVRALVAARPDDTLAEWAEALAAQHALHVSIATVSRTLRQLGLTRKKRR